MIAFRKIRSFDICVFFFVPSPHPAHKGLNHPKQYDSSPCDSANFFVHFLLEKQIIWYLVSIKQLLCVLLQAILMSTTGGRVTPYILYGTDVPLE